MAWRYLLQRFTESGWGEFIHTELPLKDVSVTSSLSATDELTATVSPALASLKDDNGVPIFDEWGTAIWAEDEGDIRGGGILTSSQPRGDTWGLRCIGLSGYPYQMPYTGSGYMGVEVDPADVWRASWAHVLGQPFGNIGLEIPEDFTTPVRIGTELEQVEFDTEEGPVAFEAGPIKMNWYETHDLGDFNAKLAQSTPFDYREVHWWEGSTIRHKLEAGYPRLGRRLTDMRFVLGENIFIPPDVDRDGAKYASDALVLGAGDGRTMIKGYAHNSTGKIRRVVVVEDKSLKSLSAANARAQAFVKAALVSGSVSSVTVSNHPNAPVTGIRPGDEFLLIVPDDWQDLSLWVRVNSVTLSPESSDDAVLSIVRSDQVA